MTNLQIRESAKSLFDGGWRSTDYDRLMDEYDLSYDETNEITSALEDLEEESEHTYELYEDNAGNLYLVVIIAGIPTRIYENWEQMQDGTLRDSIHELAADKLAYLGWNNECQEWLYGEKTIAQLYSNLGTLIAKITENGGTYYPDRMGIAARLALGIPQEV